MIEPAHILVVDDNTSLCKTMSFILHRKGFKVTTANDGFEAVEKVRQGHFDVIFMDIKMPGIDGVETYKRIKKIRPEVVVMMTAYSVDGLVEEALQEGAYKVLYKPLEMEKVLLIVGEIMQGKQRASAL